MVLLHESRHVRRLCFFTCKQLWITKKEEGSREEGREGDHKIVSYTLLSVRIDGLCCCFNLFRYFGPHQLLRIGGN